jgi:hypothetical protein
MGLSLVLGRPALDLTIRFPCQLLRCQHLYCARAKGLAVRTILIEIHRFSPQSLLAVGQHKKRQRGELERH